MKQTNNETKKTKKTNQRNNQIKQTIKSNKSNHPLVHFTVKTKGTNTRTQTNKGNQCTKQMNKIDLQQKISLRRILIEKNEK